MQGDCATPPPGAARLSGYQPGQCLLDASISLFTFVKNAAAPDVWLDGLYLRAPIASDGEPVNTLFYWGPDPPGVSSLWMTNVSTSGGAQAIYGRSSAMYLASARSAILLFPSAKERSRVRVCKAKVSC